MTVRPFFKWFDFWVGFYVDTENKRVYICPVPMMGVRIQWGDESEGVKR
ncbi:hypothetical protein LCGC14_1372340 [marine sediment metagenome]|uniref:Uncharacterized protein n=1 Tax=marine sediment metagenome TaxID=412755 RepID=A0A0F9K5B8_9ZZZZ